MKGLKSKIPIGIISFAFGIASVFGAQHLFAKKKTESPPPLGHNLLKVDPLFDQFFNHEFDSHAEGLSQFDSWYGKKFGDDAAEISKREDEKFVYYDVSIQRLEPNKLNVKVENGQIEISGEINKKLENQGEQGEFKSSFHRSFPAPSNVDPNKVEMEHEKDKLVLKFPKVVGFK